MTAPPMTILCFDQLFTGSEWLRNVRLTVDAGGTITAVKASPEKGATHFSKGATHFSGCALPGIANLHSHAHQRAMAGLAERRGTSGNDSFWTWRSLMYGHLETMSPDDLEAIAAQLYVEMLEAGYTAVGEFQYLHHDPDGRPYADPAEKTLRCLAAAREVGLGFTALPVFYARGGFGGEPAGPGQRRFVHDPDSFFHLVERLGHEIKAEEGSVGIAPHSLRAVTSDELDALIAGFHGRGPIHLHIAEQTKEVEDCLAWNGRRPVAWLLDHAPVDASWCLIHCTHLDATEIRDLAATGAVAGLCPTTEANLGDGIFPARAYLAAGGRIGIGSDSHVSTSPVEELRWLEYAQRLTSNERSVLAGGPGGSTGRRLLEAVLDGGARACDRPIGAIAPGCRADLVVLDTEHPLLAERDGDEILDSWIFSGNVALVRDVVVGGRHVVKEGRHPKRDEIAARFVRALRRLRRRTA